MKKVLSITLIILFSHNLIAGKIDRAYEALQVYNYFKAKELFEKVLDKEIVAAPYGLSIIYGRNDNPFYNLDSAFKYISIADSNYHKLDARDLEDLHELKVDSTSIENWKDTIDIKVFKQVLKSPSVRSFQSYIDQHHDSPVKASAIQERNSLAFENARSEDNSAAYQAFTSKYPDSDQYYEAQNLYELRLFQEQTESKSLAAYQNFVSSYPNSPYQKEAQDSIYSLSISKRTVKAYYSFIKNNPDNYKVNHAWRTLYKLYMSNYSPERIIEFRLDYPDYPFKDDLLEDMKLALTTFLPFKRENLWGYMDTLGEIKISPKYEFAEPFQEGLALVGLNGKIGYIDKSGDQVLPFEFEDGESFHEGLAVVMKDDYYGLIDKTAATILPFEYELIGPFNSSLAVIANDTAYGYVNTEGQITIPINLKYASDFKAGYAIVELAGKKGMINDLGRLVIPANYQWMDNLNQWGVLRAKNDSMFGLLDNNASTVLPFQYDRIGEFSEGLAMIVQGDKYGYVNYHGKVIVEPSFPFKLEALLWGKYENYHAKFYQNNKFGIIDSSGDKVFPAIFEDVGTYIEESLIAVKKRGKWGFSNTNLNLVIPYKYEFAKTFRGELAQVKSNNQWGLVDKTGKVVVELVHDEIEQISSDTYIVKKGDLYGFYLDGQSEAIDFSFNDYQEVSHPYISLERNGEVLYYNKIQKTFVTPKR